MNNIARAAEIIDSLHAADQILVEGSVGYFDAPAAAQELADAGLLAPELPDESWPQVWEVNGFLVTAIEDGGETICLAEHEGDGNEGFGWFMDKHLARKLAHALLAAAQHTKGQA